MGPGRVRLFVAAYPPEPACAHLAEVVDRLAVGRAAASGVNPRLAPRANWHLTVAFLGDVPDARAEDVPAALTRAVGRWRAEGGAPPRLRLAGGGRFGRGRFTVLWVGVTGGLESTGLAETTEGFETSGGVENTGRVKTAGGADGLKSLAASVRSELKRARLPYDPKPLRPHLTLARPGDRLDVRDDVAALAAYQGPEWTVTELMLVRSHLGPKPTYDRIATVPL